MISEDMNNNGSKGAAMSDSSKEKVSALEDLSKSVSRPFEYSDNALRDGYINEVRSSDEDLDDFASDHNSS